MDEVDDSRGQVFLAVPLVLVNASAIWGQAGWAYDNLKVATGVPQVVVALLFACAVESVGVYLAWEAHEALMADQASALLRVGSYVVGLLAGALNFQHFAPRGLPTAVAFGALSSISPWLWAVWSRARNRARLAELGVVDVRGVRLSTARKVWHPIKSVRVLRWSAWAGVTNPQQAVRRWEASRGEPEVPEPLTEGGDTGELERARALVAAGRAAGRPYGRGQLAAELGVSAHRARALLEQIDAERDQAQLRSVI